MATVSNLQKRIANLADQSSDAVTEGGETWDLRLEYLNRAQREWSNTYQWTQLYKEVNTLTSQSTGNASVSMPSDFKKIDGYLTVATSNTVEEYPQVLPEKISQYASTDEYFYMLGNPGDGYNMVVNPGTHGSGASIKYSYWATAATLASPTDQSMCPDDDYLVEKSLAYEWKAFDDARFEVADMEAEKILRRMLEFENTRGHAYNDRVQTTEETRSNFVIGRD